MLYDGAKGRIYTLNTEQKTYFARPVKEAWKTSDALLPVSPAGTDFDVKLKLTKTDAVVTKAGLSAQRYEVIGSEKAQTPQESRENRPEGSRRSGGRGRRFPRGGFPGGGFPMASEQTGDRGDRPGRSFPGGRAQTPFSIQVEGELWLASDSTVQETKMWTVAALAGRMIPQSPLLKAVVERLNKMKLVPLASSLTFRFQGAEPPQGSLTMTTEVQSISEEALDDSLFAVPADYHMSSAQ